MKRLINKYKSFPVQVKASFWFLVCSFLQRGISVITTPIFTRLISTEDYGQYGVFNSWLEIIGIFVTLRLYYGVFVQGLVKYEDDRAQFVSSMQGLGFCLSLAWTIIYLCFHNFWNSLFGLTTVHMLAMMLMIWATGAFRYWAAEQRNSFKYRALVAVTIAVSIMKPALGILLVINSDDKVTARILGLAIAECIGYSWTFIYHMSRGKKFYSAKYWKTALMFNIPLIPHYLSQTVLNSADRIMIRNMVGPGEAGIYTLAYSISMIMTIFNQALINTIQPWLYQKIKAKRIQDIAEVVYAVMIGIAAINLALIGFAPEVITIFAPPAYHNAIWVIPPVTMGIYFLFLYHMFAAVEFYFEKTKMIMVASMTGAVLNIFLNYIFIQKFGYYAAGYTTLICYLVYVGAHYLLMIRVCDKELNGQRVYDNRMLLLISGSFMAMGFIFLFTYYNNVARYLLIAVLLMVVIWKRKLIIRKINEILTIRKSRKKPGAQQ